MYIKATQIRVCNTLKELSWTRRFLFMRNVNATDEHQGIKIYLTIFTMSCHSLYHVKRASRSACNNRQNNFGKFTVISKLKNFTVLIIFTRP